MFITTNEFTSHKAGKVFKMMFAASCKSSNIVYLISCEVLANNVGKTGQQLHCRINSHHFDIRQRRTEESPVAEHFNGAGNTIANLTVVAIDQLYSHNACLHKIRESRWLRTLRTSHPFEMNHRVESLSNLLNDYPRTP